MRRRPPRGAVALLGLGLVFLGGLALVFTGVLSGALADRQKGGHLADAAALSAANWYAQSLNYEAYANRAIAANEIMIAQSLTALSWVDYLQQFSQNAAYVGSIFPPARAVLQGINQAALLAREYTEGVTQAEVPFRSGYTRALQASQVAIHAAASPFATNSLLNEVIWSGDRRYFGHYLPTGDVLKFFHGVRSYGSDERTPMYQHVMGSLDSYTRGRGFQRSMPLVVTTGCIPIRAQHLFAQLARRGGTGMEEGFEEWASADTLSLHFWSRRGRFRPQCSGISERLPLGWGGAEAPISGQSGMQDHGNYANPRAFSLANQGAPRVSGYLGLSTVRDLSEPTDQRAMTASFRVPVLVRIRNEDSHVSWFARRAGSFSQTKTLGDAIWNLSLAEARFEPPEVERSQQNIPSLFLPYWHAALAAPSSTDEFFAWTYASQKGSDTP